ncbi:unnamed protein product [Moneuplotes crassus]|uniref:Uncharacterized protein n=1 Tax=Euplotes crassus TaxID=5936 RepID=A0AAD1Y947_EUPCR|nr:unnamed protein product [Moneuplotes crassus]
MKISSLQDPLVFTQRQEQIDQHIQRIQTHNEKEDNHNADFEEMNAQIDNLASSLRKSKCTITHAELKAIHNPILDKSDNFNSSSIINSTLTKNTPKLLAHQNPQPLNSTHPSSLTLPSPPTINSTWTYPLPLEQLYYNPCSSTSCLLSTISICTMSTSWRRQRGCTGLYCKLCVRTSNSSTSTPITLHAPQSKPTCLASPRLSPPFQTKSISGSSRCARLSSKTS